MVLGVSYYMEGKMSRRAARLRVPGTDKDCIVVFMRPEVAQLLVTALGAAPAKVLDDATPGHLLGLMALRDDIHQTLDNGHAKVTVSEGLKDAELKEAAEASRL